MRSESKDVRLPAMVIRSEAESIDGRHFRNSFATRAQALRLLIQRGLSRSAEEEAVETVEARSS